VINEMADASDYTKEFVELYYDAGSAPADTVPPAAITDLAVVPLSDTSVQLTWTASGDDGTTGTATGYTIKRSSRRILTEGDFGSATLVTESKSALPSGSAEQHPVNGLDADTSYYFALKVSDEVPNASGLSTCAWGTTAPTGGGGPATDHLVISQIQTAGDYSGHTADDEFVELYNPTASAVSIAGWSLQYHSTSTSGDYVRHNIATGSIAAHGYYLFGGSYYNGTPAANETLSPIQLSGSAATVFLVNDQNDLTACDAASVVDRVAYGSGTFHCPEGTAIPQPSANNSIQRKPGGTSGSGQDTGDNSADFMLLSPSVPHSTESDPADPPSSLGNVRTTLFVEGEVSGAQLRWGSAAGATAYRIYRGTAPDFMSGSPAPWQTVAATNLVDATAPSPVLYYVIRATDGTNESPD
jgi:hypothetical protein